MIRGSQMMRQLKKRAASSIPTDLNDALAVFERAVNRKMYKIRIRQFFYPVFRLFGF